MTRALFALLATLSMAPAYAQAPKPTTFAWDANPNPDHGQSVAGYTLLIDQQQTIDAGDALTVAVSLPPGSHTATLKAYWADGTPSPQSTPLPFTVAAAVPDPCLPPLGAHAPAIFPTSPTVTTGKPGSRSFMNYQLGGPDRVVEVAVQVDGVDAAIGRGDDLRAFSGIWFTQPAAGTHSLGVRVMTSFGCALIRPAAVLVVQ